MKKWLFALVALGMFSTAFAQNEVTSSVAETQDRYWVGLSTGFPFGVTLHVGADDVLTDSADVRAIGSIFGDRVGLGIDALYGFDNIGETQGLDFYLGAGPLLSIGNDFVFGVNALVGLEYRLAPLGFAPGGVFVEAGPFLGFGDDTFVDVNARIGFNYHF